MLNDKTITTVLTHLLNQIDHDLDMTFKKMSDLPAIAQAITAVENRDFDGFSSSLIFPLDNLIDGLLNHVISQSHHTRFIFKHYEFIDAQYQSLFTKYDGLACCADKSRTILRGLLGFYLDGKKIEFNYQQEYTFHLPKNLFSTHDEIVQFFESVYKLYYGNGDAYVSMQESINAQYASGA